MDSTKKEPVPTAANMGPSSVTTGMKPFLSTCLRMTGVSARPLARAVTM